LESRNLQHITSTSFTCVRWIVLQIRNTPKCFWCLPTFCTLIQITYLLKFEEPAWWWSYGSWIYNYLCNRCLSPLTLWVRIQLMVRCIRYIVLS
jgi:hypothetical protein